MKPLVTPSAFTALSLSGCVLFFAGTTLHPHEANPNDALAAFTEYASSSNWVCTHLVQLLGVTLITFALLLLSRHLRHGKGETTASIAGGMALVSLALAVALQAVDGVALKVMVQLWHNATQTDKPGLYAATLAVRQIEIGFAAMGGCAFGLTGMLYSIALWQDRSLPRVCALLGLLGSVLFFSGGFIMAHHGFSASAMLCNMAGGLLIIAWLLWLAVLLRHSGKAA